jgi:hypothetical protein
MNLRPGRGGRRQGGRKEGCRIVEVGGREVGKENVEG